MKENLRNITEYLEEILGYSELENVPNTYSNEIFDISFGSEGSMIIFDYEDGRLIALVPIEHSSLDDLLIALTKLKIQL